MAALTQSYVHGASEKPLIGDTIGSSSMPPGALGAAAGAHRAPAEDPHELWRVAPGASTSSPPAFSRSALSPATASASGRPTMRMGADAIRHRQGRPDPGQHQSRLSPAELEYALNKVGCKALILAERFKTSDYVGMMRELAPELGDAARQARSGEAAVAALGRYPRRRPACRHLPLLRHLRAAAPPKRSASPSLRRCCNSTIRSTSSSPRAPPAFPRARRSPITTSSTTASSSARRCG